jgi:hypothetical protein
MAAGPIARAAVCSRAVDGWVAKRRSAGGTEPNSLLSNDVRFSNRPFGVKRFQTIHHHSVDVARGLVLLFGIGTKALPSWDSRTGLNNLSDGLTVNRTPGPSGMAHWANSCQTG